MSRLINGSSSSSLAIFAAIRGHHLISVAPESPLRKFPEPPAKLGNPVARDARSPPLREPR